MGRRALYEVNEEFTVLTVCTGNICRSPAVERLLRAELGAGSGIRVHSAGTGALVGEPIHHPVAGLLRELSVDADAHEARRITEAMVREADLVLALTREHRADVVELVPAAVRRTFTLREFARLAEQVDPEALAEAAGAEASPAERLAALLPLASAYRAQVDPSLDDVIDPFRRAPEVYQRSMDEIVPAVRTIADVVLERS